MLPKDQDEGAVAPVGTALDRYRVEALLGSGGMGSVYRARDTYLDRAVALKILAPGDDDGASVAAALREARACAAIHHPGVAAVYDAGDANGTAYIVMELVPGASLRRYVGDASVGVATRIRWLAEVAVALAYTHARGVVHRDVKPENVVVSDEGVVKVLDFGVARLPREEARDLSTLSEDGAVVGTPEYMAPEQMRGLPIDARVDQFAWGVVAYELLAGAKPWASAAGPMAAFARIFADDPAPFPAEAGVPEPVAAVVLRALQKRPDERFPTMDAVVEALAPHLPSEGPRLPIPSRPRPPSGPPPRSDPPPAPASGERPVAPPPARPAPRPSGATAVSPPPPEGPRFRDPDFAAPVDLGAHLAALPAGATVKGMIIQSFLAQSARTTPSRELFAQAGVAERRYLPFADYPAPDAVRLVHAAGRLAYPGVTHGEGMRRLGGAAFDAVAESRFGKVVFGVFDFDVEQVLLRSMKAYALMHGLATFSCEKAAPDRYLVHMERFAAFLETAQVGALEGILRLVGKRARIRIRLDAIDRATFEIVLV